jgi:hypothetical protein
VTPTKYERLKTEPPDAWDGQETQQKPAAPEPEGKKRGKSAASESRAYERDVDDLLEGIEAYIKKNRPGLSQKAARIEQTRMREAADAEAKLIKYRTLLNMIIPGFEGIVKVSKIAEEPGNREFFKSMKLRV